MFNKIKEKWLAAMTHEGLIKYVRNTGWVFGGQILKLLLGFIISVVIAREMGAENFGIYNYVISSIAIITTFATLGIQNIAKREMISHPENKNEILGTCIALNTIAGIILYVIMMAYVMLSKDNIEHVSIYALLGLTLLIFPFEHIESWFHAQVNAKLSVFYSILVLVAFTIIKLIAIQSEKSIILFSGICAVELIILLTIRLVVYNKVYGSVKNLNFSLPFINRLLKESWPVYLTGIAMTIDTRIDQVMIGNMLDKSSVGIYSAATRISMMWYFVPMLLCNSLYPAILNARTKNHQLYLNRLTNLGAANALIAYIIIAFTILFGDKIIQIIYGLEYRESAYILKIHILTTIPIFIGAVICQYINTEKKHIFLLCTASIGAIVNITMNLVLIPKFGCVGAAFATIASQGPLFYLILATRSSMKDAMKVSIDSMLLRFR